MTASSLLVAMSFFLKVSWIYIHNNWSSNFLNLMRSLSFCRDWLSLYVIPQTFSTQSRSSPLKIGIHSLQYCLWLDLWYSSCLTFYCSNPMILTPALISVPLLHSSISETLNVLIFTGLGDGIWCWIGIHTLDHNVWGITKLIYSSGDQEIYMFLNIIKNRA